MASGKFYYPTLIFILAMLGYLSYEIMKPFLTAIAWAIVFSIVYYPVYVFLSRHIRIRSLTSMLTVFLIFMTIIGPVSYLTFMLVDELRGVVGGLSEERIGEVQEAARKFKAIPFIQKVLPYTGFEDFITKEVIVENIRKSGKVIVDAFSLRISNVLSGIADFIFMLFTAFFLLRDGPDILSKARDYMPFSERQKKKITAQIKDLIVSTVYGGVVVAIIQGLLGGLAFYVSGINSPVLWGVVMSFMSFVPMVGTFAVWGPASLYLFITGEYLYGAGLFLYGILVISMVDNILRPLIVGSRTKMPTILILFSALGGIKFLGMIGLIMGPLIVALFISVFEIFIRIGENA